jgi:4'-phosphopantetheinyl transferase
VDDRPAPTVRVLLAQFDGQGGPAAGETLAGAAAGAWTQPAQRVDGEDPPLLNAMGIHPARHWAEAQALLTPLELGRADRLRDFRDRQTYVYAHALLRLLLGHASGGEPVRADFAAVGYGKPRLDFPGQPVHFSLSYRRGLVALAVGDAPLGIDIEVIRPGIDMLGIGRRFFTEEESAVLEAPQADVAARFFGLWTRKEALIKAAGVGIDFMPAAGALKCRSTLADEYGTVRPYCVHQFASTGNYAMALAVELSHPPA